MPKDPADTTFVYIDDKPKFLNKRAYKTSLLVEEINKWNNYFIWANRFPNFINILIGSASFCIIGIMIFFLKKDLIDKEMVDIKYILLMPFLGILTSFVILGVSYLVPNLITQDPGKLKPIPLMMISLFVGIFLKEFYTRISNYFSKNTF